MPLALSRFDSPGWALYLSRTLVPTDLVNIRKHDPLKRNAVKGDHEEEPSPMDPPDAYKPPGEGLGVGYEDMHPFLQKFRDEHVACIAELDAFDKTLAQLENGEREPGVSAGVGRFLDYLEAEVLPHNRREEAVLFRLLARRLRESGEHSKARKPTTAVDVLEDDHVQLIQLHAIMLNSFALVARLPDPDSQAVVLKAAVVQSRNLVDTLRLHIFREDHIAFSLAHELISTEEFDAMAAGEPQAV